MATKISKIPRQQLLEVNHRLQVATQEVEDFCDTIGHDRDGHVAGLARLRQVIIQELGRRTVDGEDF